MRTDEEWHPGHLRELDDTECRELLTTHRNGRVAWCEPAGPVVLPVSYRFDGEHVLFRTSPHSELARHFAAGPVAFQVDSHDDPSHTGWSVLVRGRAELLDWDELPDDGDRPEPWADGSRNAYIRIDAERLTGRRVLPT